MVFSRFSVYGEARFLMDCYTYHISLGCQDCLAAVSLADILINFHFEARRRVIRIRLLERNADETKCEH